VSIAAAVRSRDRKVFASITEFGQQSLRKIAKAVGLTKDSVARSLAALLSRNKYPESHFWETEAGQAWLCLLVIGTLYTFGLKGNQGAERISEFLKLVRVNTHVGVSPTALRTMMREMEELLVEFGQMQEEEQRQEGVEREIVGSGDETWFNDKMLLVLMDLISGYLVLEEEAKDRSYETWEAKAQSRLKQLGLRVRHFISDRGKSLVKLATSSLGCLAGADIFHAQYDLSKWLGRSLHGKFGRASQQLQEAEEKMASLAEKKAAPEEIGKQEQCIEQCREKLKGIEAGRQAYHQAQRSVSAAVHAFSVEENTPQSSEQVESLLEEEAQRFEEIAEEQSVPDNKDAVGKFRRQIKDVASIVDAWWLWTKESLDRGLSAEIRYWLLHILLPVIYWHHQLQKTQNPEMKKLYEVALRQAQSTCAAHPVTQTMSKKDLDRWRSWAKWASGNFHRASSAVEGRNGCLAQCYHNGRGLTNRRLKALTTIHNYDTRRHDGSTPAERLYGEQFPDLFEWLLGQMGALPLPRKARQRTAPNPLDFKPVAA
jgi:hypothetical protein